MKIITVDHQEFNERTIRKMLPETLHNLVAHISNKKDLLLVQSWTDNEDIKQYIDKLIVIVNQLHRTNE